MTTKIKRKVYIVCLVVLLVMIMVPFSYAAYTSVTTARRVVSTSSASDYLFSSNYLSLLPKGFMGQNNSGSQYEYKNTLIAYQGDTQVVYLNVCNYAQGYLSSWSRKNINYCIQFTLVDSVNHTDIKADDHFLLADGTEIVGAEILSRPFWVSEGISNVGQKAFNAGKCSFSGQKLITGDRTTQNLYTIFMDTAYADIACVKIEVITDNDSPAYSEYGLGGVLKMQHYEASQTAGWSGMLLDVNASKQPASYFGFNYEIFGVGQGALTITWDPSFVRISEISLAEVREGGYLAEFNAESGTMKMLVGREGQNDRYSFQFYRVSPSTDDEKWIDINNKFGCIFE